MHRSFFLSSFFLRAQRDVESAMLAALRSLWPGRRAMTDPLIAVVGATGTGKSKVNHALPLDRTADANGCR